MLQSGDILFVRGHETSLVDDLIKSGEWLMSRKDKIPFAKCYVHVCAYVGGNTVMEAQGLRRSGPANIGDYAGDYDIGHVIGMTYEQCQQFLGGLHAENDLPYDWVGIFWLIARIVTFGLCSRKYKEHKRRYCSKYIEWALKQAGIVVDGTTPETLALDPRVAIEKG